MCPFFLKAIKNREILLVFYRLLLEKEYLSKLIEYQRLLQNIEILE